MGSPAAAGYESPNHASIVMSSMSTVGGYVIFRPTIEDVRTLAGETVVISFYAKAASGTPKISVEIDQYFGSGGSPSADTQTDFGQVTLSTSWARYSVTGTIPSVSGKTLGTTANTSTVRLNLWLSAGSNWNARTGSLGAQNNTFDIWGMQLERGSNATPLEVRSHAEELARCQRHYQRYDTDASNYPLAAGAILNTTTANVVFPFVTTMRAAPTMETDDATAFDVITGGGTRATTAMSFSGITTTHAQINLTDSGAGLTAGEGTLLRGDGGELRLYAEL